MNLVNKILATGLTCFFLNGFGVQKSFSEDNITNEKNKYGKLFLGHYGYTSDPKQPVITLGWDTNHDGKEDLEGLYTVSLSPEPSKFDLDLELVAIKSDDKLTNEMSQEKYSKFSLKVKKRIIILGWYKCGGPACLEKMYYYQSRSLDKNKRTINELAAIKKMVNGTNSFVYKSKSFGK
ncbi:Uncharacterised protein [uncultured archaeon]|nr:Uncharacterised protein [uncultured archaeon]